MRLRSEHLVHHSLALLIAHEASGVTDEGTNDARSESREERLDASLLVNRLGALHEALDLTLRLDKRLHLQRRLDDIQRVDASPVGDSSHTSSHELREGSLVLHVGQRLVLLQKSATVQLVETEVQRHSNRITDQSGAETLIAAQNAVGLDDLLDSSRHSRELSLVLRIVLSTDDLDLELGLEQIHGGLNERHGHTSNGSGNEGVTDRQNLSMTNSLLHLTVHNELDGVEEHVTYAMTLLFPLLPQRGEMKPL